MRIVIIGAGAAGCFAAIEAKRLKPEAEVIVLEKSRKPLAKVSITGGGRCNLTNSFADIKNLEHVYPRGFRLMKKLFHHFSHEHTMQWFEDQGVKLVTQDDNCVFPKSQDAMEIVETLLSLIKTLGIKLYTNNRVLSVTPLQTGYDIEVRQQNIVKHIEADKVLISTGGQPSKAGFDILSKLELKIAPPVPSLFSFNIDDDSIKSLTGTVVNHVQASIPATKHKTTGALLLTHWGMSGPAALKLSSVAARHLAENDYKSQVIISWLGSLKDEELVGIIRKLQKENQNKMLSSVYPSQLNSRLWQHLLTRAKLNTDTRWKDINTKDIHRLVNTLSNDTYTITGKCRFKDEFVTCGGVALSEINSTTLEAKNYPGLYFAGEFTDVDAITGGFNLQAAWTMAIVAARAMTS